MKKLIAAATLAAMVAVSGISAKPNPDETKNINRFGHVGLLHTHSAQTMGFMGIAFNAHWNTAVDKDFIKNIYVRDQNGNWIYDPSIDPMKGGIDRHTINIGAGLGLARWADLGFMMPIYVDNIGERRQSDHFPSGSGVHGFPVGDGDGAYTKRAFGDIDLSLKLQYPPYPHRNFFKAAYYLALSIPTGDKDYGFFPRHRYYTDRKELYGVYQFYNSGSPEIGMKMLQTMDFREMSDNMPLLIHLNYGLRWATQSNNNHTFLFNFGAEFRPIEWFNIFTEFTAEPRFSSIQLEENRMYVSGYNDIGSANGSQAVEFGFKQSNMLDDPMRIGWGLAFLTPIGVTISGGMQHSLANKDGFFYGNEPTAFGRDNVVLFETGVEPKHSVNVTLGFNMATRPSIAPVTIPEPEPRTDTIRVRVVDTVFVDRFITDTIRVEVQGTPAPVRTHTITASVAAGAGTINPVGVRTVNEGSFAQYTFTPAEGFEIEQVTVNGLNQGALAQFSFPSVRENQIITVSFREIPRPVVVEVAAPTPVAVEIPREGLILRGVNFQTGSARLTPASFEVLDGVIRSLRDWPEVMLEIQGHTDATGSRSTNMRLSKQRAESVMNYFIQQGVPASRLRAVGYGPDVPISDNETAAGRELNRRVELKRFD